MADDPVEVSRDGDRVVIRWTGDVDTANVRWFEQRSLGSVENSDTEAILDLHEVTYLDSAGIRAILAMHRALSERQQSMRLVIPDTSVCRKALSVAGVDAVMPIAPTLDA